MPRASYDGPYAPPVSIRDIHEHLSLEAMQRAVATLEGAVYDEPKPKTAERWRYVLPDDIIVICYPSSLVVTGIDRRRMQQIAEAVRNACRAEWRALRQQQIG